MTARSRFPSLCTRRSADVLLAGSLAILFYLLPGPGGGPAVASEIDVLLRHFASRPGFSAEFREVKRMELLVDPLISTAALYFSPPDLLARHTFPPSPSILTIQGEELRFGEGEELTGIDLASNPTLRTFVGSFRALLAGDAMALRANFSIDYESGSDAAGLPTSEEIWEIRLTPLRSPLREQITRIALRGTGLQPREMHVLESGGDQTLTELSAVNTERSFDSAERIELFRLPRRKAP